MCIFIIEYYTDIVYDVLKNNDKERYSCYLSDKKETTK